MEATRLNTWLRWCFFWLLLTAVYGLSLRLAHIHTMPTGFDYPHIRHAHSHLGMMGWLYCGLYTFSVWIFGFNRPIYWRIFMLTLISLLGMAVSFPLQGYGMVSIACLCIHLINSYVYFYFAIRDIRKNSIDKHAVSTRFYVTALVLMALSTVGVWALGFLMSSSLKNSPIYFNSIQFFLHFQFNGWFVFGILGLVFRLLENQGFVLNVKNIRRFYWLLVISCFMTFAQAITWANPIQAVFYVNSVGVVLQALALGFLLKWVLQHKGQIKKWLPIWPYRIFFFALICFTIKVASQLMVAHPELAITSYTIRNFIVGFIHLILLGMISAGLFGLTVYYLKKTNKIGILGIKSFGIGFVLTETFLFVQGILLWTKKGFMPYYYEALFTSSLFMLVGAVLLFIYIFGVTREAGS